MVRNPGGRVVARFSLDIRRLEQLCVTWHRPAGRCKVLLSIFSSFGKSNSLRYFSPFIFIPDSTKMIDVLPITPSLLPRWRLENKTKPNVKTVQLFTPVFAPLSFSVCIFRRNYLFDIKFGHNLQ